MEKNAWSMPELKDSEALVEDPAPTKELTRSKSAKQFTWVLLLRVNKLVGFMAWVGSGVATLVSHVRHRLLTKEGLEHGVGGPGETKPTGRLLRVLRFMLIVSVLMLVFEIFTHWQGWHSFGPHIRIPETSGLHSFLHWFYLSWVYVRKKYIGPPLQYAANACIWLFMLQSIDRFILFLGCIWINLRGYKPKPVSNIEEANPEDPGDDFPMVLVQIPMCNEREVFDQSIGAACQLDWPKNRMLVQVLDDSDDEEIQMLIRTEVQKWLQKGAPITYRHRLIRKGYKAGNLKSAMSCDYVKDYEFVAIFDADFQPRPDFLKRTIPHFKGRPDVGLVQARWAFVNKDENLLTRLQHINLSYHFEVEQQVNGAFIHFFGFNGTAGVWRISALEESGGWLDRTTVEDMDIAVRAHLKGWKFVFLNDVEALCELPESYEAYRKQQHRWHSGPMQLFRLCLPDIISAKIELWKKINMVFLFFLLRKMILPFYSFTLFCIILPITMFIPEASLPLWVVCYVPALMSIMNVVPSPKSFPFIVPYLLFENTMSVTKFNAMVAGLFQLHSSYEWVVTKKTGRASEADLLAMVRQDSAAFEISAVPNRTSSEVNLESKATNPAEKVEEDGTVIIDQKTVALAPTTPHAETPRTKEKKPPRQQKMYRKELALAMLLLVAAARSLLTEHGMHFYFLLFQGLAFLVVGLDLISDSPV